MKSFLESVETKSKSTNALEYLASQGLFDRGPYIRDILLKTREHQRSFEFAVALTTINDYFPEMITNPKEQNTVEINSMFERLAQKPLTNMLTAIILKEYSRVKLKSIEKSEMISFSLHDPPFPGFTILCIYWFHDILFIFTFLLSTFDFNKRFSIWFDDFCI